MKLNLFMFLCICTLLLSACSTTVTTSNSGLLEVNYDGYEALEFVEIPGDEKTGTFYMATTEVTNEQYAKFLNEAMKDGLITLDAPEKDHFSLDNAPKENTVWDLNGNPLIYLGGSRVVKDHNKDGEYSLAEMENPLNRCYIEFDEDKGEFQVVDPKDVDWTIYFDTDIYPNVVDSINDWAELNPNKTGKYEYGDLDMELPFLEEVKKWPATFIRYYGADAYAKYYGYELPTKEQWQLAAKGGNNFKYPTSNGEKPNAGNEGNNPEEINVWYNPKGIGYVAGSHAQPVKSIASNPLGLYGIGGNVWEWISDWYLPNPDMDTHPMNNTGGESFVDDEKSLVDIRIDLTQPISQNNQYTKSLIGGSFNYPDMVFVIESERFGTTHPFLAEGNDHFGFRVMKDTK